MRHPGPLWGPLLARQAQNGLEPGAALGQMFPHVPEAEQRNAEAEGPVQLPCLKQPFQRETEVVDLNVAAQEPERPVGRAQFWVSFFRQDETVRCVRATARGLLSAIGETLLGILTNCF